MASRRPPARRRTVDPVRRVAFDALRSVHADDAYANLVLPPLLTQRRITGRDAAFATELLAGTCRLEGTYDQILVAASGRAIGSLQPAVLDLLRLGCHQLLSMRVPTHAAVAATVDLAAATVGERVTGLVNAVLRKVAARSYEEWTDELSVGLDDLDALALRTAHPRWIAAAYADLLPAGEVETALLADNDSAAVSLVVRPGLAAVEDLLEAGAEPGGGGLPVMIRMVVDASGQAPLGSRMHRRHLRDPAAQRFSPGQLLPGSPRERCQAAVTGIRCRRPGR